MAGRVVFLLEEPSMKLLLEGLLPRLVPGWVAGEHFLCVPHQGKSDLDVSIPRKLSAWQVPGDRFVVVRDNDAADCVAVLKKVKSLCAAAGRPDTLVRLVCQELETWYLSDLEAVAAAFEQPKVTRRRCERNTPIPMHGKNLRLKSSGWCLLFRKALARAPWRSTCANRITTVRTAMASL